MSIKSTMIKPYTIIAVGLVAAAAVIGAMNAIPQNQGAKQVDTGLPMRAVLSPNTDSATLARALNDTFADLAERASEAVVHINSGNPGEASQFAPQMGGVGSGFIFSSDGWIVTNDHVVAGAQNVTVVLADGREFKGTVRRANDDQLDIALVKIEASGLPTLPVADSSTVRPGQFAIAVGSPFGLDNSVTVGHISAIGRRGQVMDGRFGQRGYNGMIQTDASINPGNSGGPLLDIDGRVIGVNTSIASTNGTSMGIGFAIPSSVVKVVANKMISKGKFDRGLLGVAPEDLKPFEKKELGITGGAIVRAVPDEGPAKAAGLQVGDVITKIGDLTIRNEMDLRIAMYENSPGQSVSVTYVRKGAEKTVQIKLQEPERLVAAIPQGQRRSPLEGNDPFPAPQGRPRLGVSVAEISESERGTFGIPKDVEGVVVVGVASGSVADKIGLEPGDVIVRIGDRDIVDAQDVRRAVESISPGETRPVQFKRWKAGVAVTQTIDAKF